MENVKLELERKLADALFQLRLEKKMADYQRTFGFALGIRVALIQVNQLSGIDAYSFKNAKCIHKIMDDMFGQKTLKQLNDYAFPEMEQ